MDIEIKVIDGVVWIQTPDGSCPEVLCNGQLLEPEKQRSTLTLDSDGKIQGAVMGDLTIDAQKGTVHLSIEGDVVGSLTFNGKGSVSTYDVGASVKAGGDVICQGKIGGSATAGGDIHSSIVHGTSVPNMSTQD